jgi:hypothetical protein
MMIDVQAVIADSPNQSLLTALTKGDLEKALSLATEMMANDNSTPHAVVAEYFVKMVQSQGTDNTSLQNQYFEKLKGKEVILFVAEFSRLLMALKHPNIDEHLFFTVAKWVDTLIWNIVQEIAVNSGDYPHDVIQANVWFEGAALREWCQLLADFYQEANLLEYEASVTFAKAKATLSIMSHYHHFVGPDMISAAKCYERLGNDESAKQSYYAVIMDFKWLIDDYLKEEETEDEKDEEVFLEKEDYTSLMSLAAAYKGYFALCSEEDEQIPNQLASVESLLKRKPPA